MAKSHNTNPGSETERILRDKLREASVAPPDALWDRIENDLGPAPAETAPLAMWKLQAAIVALIFLGGIGYMTWLIAPDATNAAGGIAQQSQDFSASKFAEPTSELRAPDQDLSPGAESGLSLEAATASLQPQASETAAQTEQAGFNFTEQQNSASTVSRVSVAEQNSSESSVLSVPSGSFDQIAFSARIASNSPAARNTAVPAGAPVANLPAEQTESVQDHHVGSVIPEPDFAFVPTVIADLNTEIAELSDREANDLGRQSRIPRALQGFYGGAQASLMHTSLISESTAPVEDVNLDPISRVGTSWGFTFGYRFNDQLSLETGLVVDSRQGSDYSSVIETNQETFDVTKRIQLVYSQIPLVVRFSHGSGFTSNQTGKLHYVAGLQYGYLRNSRLAIENRPVSPDRDFQKHDFAAVFGLDYDLDLGDHLSLSMGARAAISANQTRVVDLQGVNQDKRNAIFGFRTALNYSLGAR